jgi:hypothetical protein
VAANNEVIPNQQISSTGPVGNALQQMKASKLSQSQATKDLFKAKPLIPGNTISEQQTARNIFRAISFFDLDQLKVILSEMELRKSLEIVNLYDDQGRTALHVAANQDTYSIAAFLIGYFKG